VQYPGRHSNPAHARRLRVRTFPAEGVAGACQGAVSRGDRDERRDVEWACRSRGSRLHMEQQTVIVREAALNSSGSAPSTRVAEP
jgi:hypothetical protein